MKASEALFIAIRTNDPIAWTIARVTALVQIGRFGRAMVRGLEAHAERESARKKALFGGYVVEPRH